MSSWRRSTTLLGAALFVVSCDAFNRLKGDDGGGSFTCVDRWQVLLAISAITGEPSFAAGANFVAIDGAPPMPMLDLMDRRPPKRSTRQSDGLGGHIPGPFFALLRGCFSQDEDFLSC
jgi:hypothetical protein